MSSATVADRRRQAIVALLRRSGAVTIEQITVRFGVSPMTARRDLDRLERGGLLVRRHGGAVLSHLQLRSTALHEPPVGANGPLAPRARQAVDGLVPGQAVFLDGTPLAQAAAAEIVARAIRTTVITNALSVIATVEQPRARSAPIELIGIGGRFDRADRVFVGAAAVEQVGRHFADLALLGDLEASYGAVAEVRRTMARQALIVVDGGLIGATRHNGRPDDEIDSQRAAPETQPRLVGESGQRRAGTAARRGRRVHDR